MWRIYSNPDHHRYQRYIRGYVSITLPQVEKYNFLFVADFNILGTFQYADFCFLPLLG
jgi:hypothetical protein